MQKPPHAFRLARRRNLARQFDMRAREFRSVRFAAMPLQHADQIDDRIALFDERDERGELHGIVHIGFDHIDRQERQMLRIRAPARGDVHHGLAEIDERIDQMTADETRTADQRYVLMSHSGLVVSCFSPDAETTTPARLSTNCRKPRGRETRRSDRHSAI